MRHFLLVVIVSLSMVLAIGLPRSLQGQDVLSFRALVGHDFGERITTHPQMLQYVKLLAERSPRVSMVAQGTSWEGRQLALAIVTSPENHARLEEIREAAQSLADPRRTTTADMERLLAEQPVVLWLGGSIHGFELSGSEGLLKLLDRLATAEDADTLAALRQTVVLIDPMLNPDGRDAFAHFNHRRIGAQASARPDDWSNDFTFWEALDFRTGHYFFDNNRDWFAHTQPETRHRAATIVAWRPQVVIDAHEMGRDVEFFFDPPAEPHSVYFPAYATRGFERFGKAYAAAFDAAGFEYVTRELFNYFYPGYSTSWGSYQGAIGMLYEQGSSRGLALERSDGTVRSLADALEQQYTAAWTAVATAAAGRQELLRDYWQAHREAIADGGKGARRYLIVPGRHPALERELVELLQRNSIEVGVLAETARATGLRDLTGKTAKDRDLAAGTWVVEAAQPRNRLLRTLFEAEQPLPEAFLAEARKRLDRGENPRFYDMTTWSLPLLFDLEVYSSSAAGEDLSVAPATTASAEDQPIAANAAEPYAYLVDGRDSGAVVVARHLRARGYRTAVLTVPTRIGELDIASGSAIVRSGRSDDDVGAVVRELAERFGVAVTAVTSGRGEPGYPSLGSTEVVALRDAKIAILAEDPVYANSFGWAWYVLEQRWLLAPTVLRTSSVADTPLESYGTIVIPDLFSAAAMAERLGERGLARLNGWIQDGGTLVVLADAVELARQHLGLQALRSWHEENTEKIDDEKKIEPRSFPVPGAILRGTLDLDTWLSAGYAGDLPFLVDGERLYLEPLGPPSATRRVVARFASDAPLRLGGHVWPETLERAPGAVLVYEELVGNGRIIAFAEDVNFRAYWRGAERLFLNAVVLGPSAP